MKVTKQTPSFTPVTILLETEKEFEDLLLLLAAAEQRKFECGAIYSKSLDTLYLGLLEGLR